MKNILTNTIIIILLLCGCALLIAGTDWIFALLPNGWLGNAIVICILIPVCFLCLQLFEQNREQKLKKKYPTFHEERWAEVDELRELPTDFILKIKCNIERDCGIDNWNILSPDMTIGQLQDETDPSNDCPYIASLAQKIWGISDDATPTKKDKDKLNKLTVAELIILAYENETKSNTNR